MSSTYVISAPSFLKLDGDDTALLLHDLPRNPEHWRVEALVASGDFCEMLAVSLEQIAAALPATSVEQYQIQDAIGNLLYVQRHFKLTRKTSTGYTRPNQRADAAE